MQDLPVLHNLKDDISGNNDMIDKVGVYYELLSADVLAELDPKYNLKTGLELK